jgi:hypothetical protein
MFLRNVGLISTDYTLYIPEERNLISSFFLIRIFLHWI